jgi:hypothetical protein
MLETNIQKERPLHGDLSSVLPELTVQSKRQRMTFAECVQNKDSIDTSNTGSFRRATWSQIFRFYLHNHSGPDIY